MTARWSVALTDQARADILELDKTESILVAKALEKLMEQPLLRGHSLKGNLTGLRSLVVGKRKIRIVYGVNDSQLLVEVIAIGHRHNDEVCIRASDRI
jgi:addiction module RelE/StbE family toxin